MTTVVMTTASIASRVAMVTLWLAVVVIAASPVVSTAHDDVRLQTGNEGSRVLFPAAVEKATYPDGDEMIETLAEVVAAGLRMRRAATSEGGNGEVVVVRRRGESTVSGGTVVQREPEAGDDEGSEQRLAKKTWQARVR